ncbi:V-set and immunoglobulin domain-containing protein 4 isoform X28 [Phyllobates terribilis]|uniref:V-set and immunoglobulin domain-containing protein 4 isoform X27 n=1 Tax=Phyllobates terribilis TaxID=111132 RepID=UPI003CCAF4C1
MGQFKWLFVFVICFSEGNASSNPSLIMKDIVTGVRGRSVDLPCTYTPPEYEVDRIEWSLHSEVIIIRIKSQDDVPLTKFRERVAISRAPGDVSLTIKKLNLDDKGNIKCKVTWKKPDGTLISKEKITILKILRVQPITDKPKGNIVTITDQERKTTTPSTIFTKKKDATILPEVTTTTPSTIFTKKKDATILPEVTTMQPITDKPKGNIVTITHQELKTTTPSTIFTKKKDATILPEVTTMQPITDKPKGNIVTITHQERKTTTPSTIFTKKKDATILPEVTTMQPITDKPKGNIVTITHQELKTTTPSTIFTKKKDATILPEVTTMQPITDKPKGNIVTITHQERKTTTPSTIFTKKKDATILPEVTTMQPITDKPKGNIVTITHQERKTTTPSTIFTKKKDATILPEVTTTLTLHGLKEGGYIWKTGTSHFNDISHVGTVSAMETTKLTTIGKPKEITSLKPFYSVEILYTNAAIAQSKGFGIPIYLLIIIILCVLGIATLVIAIIIKKKKKKEYIYDVPTMNHLLALDDEENGCQSCTSETRDSNTYEPYRPTSLSIYEGILPPIPTNNNCL